MVALVGAIAVFWPSLDAGWFYDDYDYVLADPRLDRMDLFLPGGWSAMPPPLPETEDGVRYLPGYGQSMFADRFLWRFSFAAERAVLGLSPRTAHTVNLLLHLSCVALLFAALTRLLRLYEESGVLISSEEHARRIPPLAALIFAVHPWVSEPVCYVSARSANLAALFVLLGLLAWIEVCRSERSFIARCAFGLLAALSVLAAFACKEHFVVASAGYLLATAPLLRKGLANRPVTHWIASGLAAIGIVGLLAWLGIRNSERAAGLFAQAHFSNAWEYLFTIQSPILLRTLADQFACIYIALETGHPSWGDFALFLGLVANGILILAGTIGGFRWPALLGLGWFYIFLLPTNSILPRPDFLAMRNVYVPVMGVAAGVAALLSILWVRHTAINVRRAGVLVASVLLGYWAVTAHGIAQEFADPVRLWARSARVSPDHATVRLNLGYSLRQADPGHENSRAIEAELRAALAAEDSLTMKWHTPRPKAVRKMLALRMLGTLRREAGFSADAETYFSESWHVNPVLQTWLKWVETCAESKLDARMNLAIDEGLKRWPDAWWPRVTRGIHQFRIAGTITEPIFDDLSSAFEAPNANFPDLRVLQARVLGLLTELDTDHTRVDKMLERLAVLGVSDADLQRLRARAMELRK